MISGLQCVCVSVEILNYVLFLQGFGQADHKMTKNILSKQFNYPDDNITCSNAGY